MKELKTNFNKIFLLSDIHLGTRNNSLQWLENQSNFFYNFYIPFLNKNKEDGDVLFILGDFFDNRNTIDIQVMNKGIDIITDISKIIPIHFLVGNHDIYKKFETNINSLQVFKYINDVIIYEKPTILNNNNNKILIMPWIGDYKKENDLIKKSKAQYVFAHTNIMGFRYDNNMGISTGLDPNINTNILRIISGHIHKRQETNKSVYIGSPYEMKRSDKNNNKGVYIFNPKDNTLLFERNNYSPVFLSHKLEHLLNKTLEEIKIMFYNNYNDILVNNDLLNLYNSSIMLDLLKDCGYMGLENISNYELSEYVNTNIDGDCDNLKDILTMLEENIMSLSYEQHIIDNLLSINKNYYNNINE